jgi:hypothetical protein
MAQSTQRQISFPWGLSLYIPFFNLGNILEAKPLHPVDKGKKRELLLTNMLAAGFNIR